MKKLVVMSVGVSLAAMAANSAISFRSSGDEPQKLGASATFASFEAMVPIGTADSVTMTVCDADGKALTESRQSLTTGRNALAVHVETLPPGKYEVLFRAFTSRGKQVAIATNAFFKAGAAVAVAKDKNYVVAADGSRAELAPGKIRANDLTPLAGVGTPRGKPIVAVAGGVARLAVVATEVQNQARWLAEVIGRMTGVDVPVYVIGTNDLFTAGPAIYVGLTRATREAGIARPGTPDSKWGIGAHAFRCVTKGNDVFIVGASGQATGYGVYDFAERVLGVRQYYWTTSGKTPEEKSRARALGEDVIVTDGLAIPQFDWLDKPVYEFRTEFAAGHPGWKFGDAHQSLHTVHAPHFWHVDPNLGYKPSRWTGRPTIFQRSENGDRATSPMLCYGNPLTLSTYKEHIDLVISGKRRGFAGEIVNLERKTVTVSQWDAAVVCHCDYCKKLRDTAAAPTGDASPIIWGYFTKELAKWMKQKYPDWRISILPYINTCDVPKGLDLTKEGNVDPYLCTMPGLALLAQDRCRKHEEELMRQWQKATGNPVQNWHYICWPADKTCAPYVFGNAAVRFYREMKGVICGSFINGDYGRQYGFNALGLSEYVWVRAMWNPGFEAKHVYDEFAKRFFGPAAVPMRKLIEMQETGWERQWQHVSVASKNIYGISYPRKEVEEMERILKESATLVKGNELYERRLAFYAKPFERFFKESYEFANNKAFAQLQMRKAAELPKIDGDLSDACWKVAEALDFTLAGALGSGNPTNLVAKYPTKMQAVWSPEGVALGITCMEPTPQLMQTSHSPGDWWGNDCLEIFVDPTGEQEGVYGKLWIDSLNQLRVQSKWKPTGLKSGVKVNADSWTVEIFIPYSDVKCFENAKIPGTQGGMNWNGNVVRLRIADAWQKKDVRTPGSVSEVSRLYTRFSGWNNDPNAFGIWKFVEQ